jgi:hypothetical protein
MKSACSQYMNVRCEHSHACPLTANANCGSGCQQIGDGIHKQNYTIESQPGDTGNQNGTGFKSAN